MVDCIDPGVHETRSELASRFRAAKPFPHVVIDRFFTPEFCDRLMADFPAFDRGCNLNENGLPGGKSTVEDIRSLSAAYAEADDLFRSPEFSALVSTVTGIPNLLYDGDYIGGGTHENLPGQDLDPHVDFNYHPRRGWHRRLNLIVYLNPEWKDDWGGALELHEDPWLPAEQNHVCRVLPLANRAIVFETSERSWHGFESIRPPTDGAGLSRKSLAIYMYTADRPTAETAPPHSTVYVERPLPFVLQPGQNVSFAQFSRVGGMLARRTQHVERLEKREREFTDQTMALVEDLLTTGEPLRQEDVELLGRIFGREDALLHTLYDREKAFTADIGNLRDRVGERDGRAPGLFGSARLVGAPVGYFPGDQWAGPVVEFDVAAARAARVLTIHGSLSDSFGGGQTLRCTVGQEEHSRALCSGAFEWRLPVSLIAGEQVHVCLRASVSVCPARDLPGSTDPRELSYHLLGVELS